MKILPDKSAERHASRPRLALIGLALCALFVRNAAATNRIAYNHSDGETRAVYQEVLRCIEKNKTETEVSTQNPSVLKRAFETVLADHGELFWTDGEYSYQFSPSKLVFRPKYTMDQSRRKEIQHRIDARVRHLLRGCPADASDYEKAKFVYQTLVREIDYDKSAPMNQTVAGPFLYGRTVCQGYACATQYLLRELGVESAIVVGQTKGGLHAWIIACLDGQYYHIDTTWGDPTFPDKEEQPDDNIDWWYLNLTTREISQDHSIESPFAPLCTATQDNYFVKEGLFLPFWSPEEADALLVHAWKSGRRTVPMKFASIPDRNNAVRHFISGNGIRALFPDLGDYWYRHPDNHPMLSIIGLPPPPMPTDGHLSPPEEEEEDYPLAVASSAEPVEPEDAWLPPHPEATGDEATDWPSLPQDVGSSLEPFPPEPDPPTEPQRFGAVAFRVNGEELDVLADGTFEIDLGQELEISVRQSNTKVTIAWGDGNTTRRARGSHVYAEPGKYTVVVRAQGQFGKVFRAKRFVVYVRGGSGFLLFILFLLGTGLLTTIIVRNHYAHAADRRSFS